MRGRRALARVEQVATARAVVDRRLDDVMAAAIMRARAHGVSWWRIGRALSAGSVRGVRRAR